jgi:hypothetical protein
MLSNALLLSFMVDLFDVGCGVSFLINFCSNLIKLTNNLGKVNSLEVKFGFGMDLGEQQLELVMHTDQEKIQGQGCSNSKERNKKRSITYEKLFSIRI